MPKKEVITYTKKLDIPEDKIAEYKEAFDMFDKDGSGTISVIEIVKIMKNFGYPIKKAEAQQMIADIDDNGDGELDFEEFVTLMEKQTNYVDESEEELGKGCTCAYPALYERIKTDKSLGRKFQL